MSSISKISTAEKAFFSKFAFFKFVADLSGRQVFKNIKLLFRLILTVALVFRLNTIPAIARPPRQPNIIVILADDLGYADVSAYNPGRFSTPNIDRIGREGARFTSAYAASPVCAPSRAALLTGRYPARFGFEFNQGPVAREVKNSYGLETNEITIADLLGQQGYHTGLVGKWHQGVDDKFYPLKRGFDEFVGFLPAETAYINPYLPGVHTLPDSLKFVEGDNPEDSKSKDNYSRKRFTEVLEGPDHAVVHNENQYLTDYWAQRSVDFIKRNSGGSKPYFLYAALNAVHAPHMVTQKYYDRFSNIKDDQQRVYAAMISALDDAVGDILAAVDASGQADNTIVVFSSDNGCAGRYAGLCSCWPLRGGKLTHYEGGDRIPFMVRWPGHVKPGLVYDKITSLMDVLPTAVNAAGGKLPADRPYDGVDLMPFLTGVRSGSPHDVLVWRREPLVSIRAGDWKLWESQDPTGVYGNYKLLFNLKDDLNEGKNLAEQHPEKVKELEGLMADWAKDKKQPIWPSAPPLTYDVCGTTFTLPI